MTKVVFSSQKGKPGVMDCTKTLESITSYGLSRRRKKFSFDQTFLSFFFFFWVCVFRDLGL